MDQEFISMIETIVTKAISHANVVVTAIEISDEGQLSETVRVSGKLVCKDALDSSFLFVLPSRRSLEKIKKNP